jgi:hypothetical protein
MKTIFRERWKDNIKVDRKKIDCDVGWWVDVFYECPVAGFGNESSGYWQWV